MIFHLTIFGRENHYLNFVYSGGIIALSGLYIVNITSLISVIAWLNYYQVTLFSYVDDIIESTQIKHVESMLMTGYRYARRSAAQITPPLVKHVVASDFVKSGSRGLTTVNNKHDLSGLETRVFYRKALAQEYVIAYGKFMKLYNSALRGEYEVAAITNFWGYLSAHPEVKAMFLDGSSVGKKFTEYSH